MTPDDHSPWWRGKRGEWLVVAQVALIVLVSFGPRTLFGHPTWPFPFAGICRVAGIVLMIAGGALLVAGFAKLGRAVTPLPYPKDEASLVETGPYALVRHPMYSGGFLLCLGFALYVQSWLTLGYVALMLVFFDYKATREEKWLAEKFPNYGDYKRRVRKLIPFIY